ncbi:MAG TPA: hypothetical protein VGB77_19825 [Abditibacteriaceae bacterium]|jgi:hypothetical protein
MRTSAGQRAYQREDLSLKMRRPPEEYVGLLSQTEQEFRSYVHTFEDSPLFDKLVKDGMISKVRLRGKIPRGKYEEFMDEQLFKFFRDYKIESFDNWEADFLSPHALERVEELAKKYSVPVGTLTKHLRYLRSSGRGTIPDWMLARPAASSDGPTFDRIDNTASESTVDLSEIIETTRGFVEQYDVSEQDFLDLVLGGESTPEELSEKFGCSLAEAQEVLEAADRVYMADTYEASGAAPAQHARAGASAAQQVEEPVAFVQVVEGQLAIQFHQDSVYAQRYRIKPNAVKELKNDPNLPALAREVLSRARFINQRLSALSRLIMTLCSQQMDYLSTGDMRQLKPLAQAELARQLGEHPSTVSRLIRNKSIETPYGVIPLLFLCQSKTDVVARLIAQFPKLTDYQVVIRLREDYDCQIARRTVAYHRGKRLRRNKIHKPRGQAGDVEAPAVKRPKGRPRKQAVKVAAQES